MIYIVFEVLWNYNCIIRKEVKLVTQDERIAKRNIKSTMIEWERNNWTIEYFDERSCFVIEDIKHSRQIIIEKHNEVNV